MKLTIAQLRAAGVSDKQILDALAEAQAQQLEKEREQSKIRSRNYRERHRVTQITRDGRDERDAPIDTSPPDPQKIQKGRKVSIATDWKPTDADREYATSKGWSDSRIDCEAERFHNHYLANGVPRKSWPASWRKWVTSPYQQPNRGGQDGRQGRRHGSVLDALDRIGERLKAAGATDDYVPGSSGPRPLELDQEVRPSGLKLVPKR